MLGFKLPLSIRAMVVYMESLGVFISRLIVIFTRHN